MDVRYLKHLYLISIIFFLAGCENPAKDLSHNKPDSFEFIFSEGGLKMVDGVSYDDTNDSLSRKDRKKYFTQRDEHSYKIIYKFLSENRNTSGFFNSVEIPPRHVLILYISYENKLGEKMRVFLGKNWIGYFLPIDSLGESGTIIYPVKPSEISKFLSDIAMTRTTE